MESNVQKTIADIIAEKRELAERLRLGTPTPYEIEAAANLEFDANRIEAAWKREKAEVEASALAAGGIVEASRHKQGNAAAMSEALEAIRDEAYERIIDGLATDADWLYKTAKAALSSPPKNCDRFATVDKAMDDFADNALIEEWNALEAGKDRDMLAKELFMFAKWLFEPAAERKGE